MIGEGIVPPRERKQNPMKRIFNFGLLSLLFSLFLTTSVQAASSTMFSVESKKIGTEDKKITTECKASDAGSVTNGKFRITYDPQKLTLEEAAAGDGLADTMVQINDPVTGNKQEGEIVFVFAAAQPVSIDGTLLKMSFNNKGLKDGESTEIQLAVEEFASESEDLTEKSDSKKGVISVGEGTTAEKNENGGSGSNGNKKPAGSVSSGSTEKKNSTSKSGNVKTGDETQIGRNVAMAAGSLFLIIVAAVAIKKKKND